MKEIVSALVDAEVEGTEGDALLERVRRDPELLAAWRRYHLIGAALRHELASDACLTEDFAQRVASALDSEPATLAPGSVSARRGRFAPLSIGKLKSALSLAAAAGLGALAVLVFQPSAETGPEYVAQQTTRWQTDQPEHEQELNALLVEHGEFMPPSGMNGLMAYARFVSYDTGR